MLSPLVVVKYPTAAACPLCAPQRVGRVASTPVASKPTSRGRSGLVRLTSRGEAVSAYADALDRRAVVLAAPSAALAQLLLAGVAAAEAEVAGAEAAEVASVAPARGKKVVVLGGNGFVGSRVCKALVDAGCEVMSVSRSGTPPSWAAGSDWVGSVTWSKGDALSDDLSGVLKGASAVVSCIGVIGGSYDSMEKGNGATNIAAAEKSKAAGVPSFVYVSVASIVPNSVGGIVKGTDFKGYFDGKKEAEEAILAAYPSSAVLIKPSFIYGGSDFGISPPRVTAGYGAGIEALLSSGPVRAIAGVSPGPVALTLAPPVSVESVAGAAAAAALGMVPAGAVDGTDAINAAAAAFS
mmetsp:Transcript_42773/g.110923  ORF Transcript_42773/g.110923 Transcript_42773/m.110923 type:complete len:352 (-) Transcript_42773:244-1299(-)